MRVRIFAWLALASTLFAPGASAAPPPYPHRLPPELDGPLEIPQEAFDYALAVLHEDSSHHGVNAPAGHAPIQGYYPQQHEAHPGNWQPGAVHQPYHEQPEPFPTHYLPQQSEAHQGYHHLYQQPGASLDHRQQPENQDRLEMYSYQPPNYDDGDSSSLASDASSRPVHPEENVPAQPVRGSSSSLAPSSAIGQALQPNGMFPGYGRAADLFLYTHPTCFLRQVRKNTRATPDERELVLYKLRRDLAYYDKIPRPELAQVRWIDTDQQALLAQVGDLDGAAFRRSLRTDVYKNPVTYDRGLFTRYVINGYFIVFRKPQSTADVHYVAAFPIESDPDVVTGMIEIGLFKIPVWQNRALMRNMAHPQAE
ncbi:uncharacterized protein PFL1_00238 [Pseudozyma flocculosa PF-1]|uniref:Uncharacterized protein n=1 Tax=Pseudozyma flocculosa TaxID=84751 RepID=A0A5C3ESL9_9BASI|nr:uncharacterized protein PFL1_00238 [Pseudozyma flocculosa PF-1]EPQ32040.1 hypothetical protein PFL1_00238 [Pseudozyma flocculosa PF-1]SPO35032.1 uncharacterized protein PSFLO_00503 [Pseudozyma flocculosa]